jgi:hypothetical protein
MVGSFGFLALGFFVTQTTHKRTAGSQSAASGASQGEPSLGRASAVLWREVKGYEPKIKRLNTPQRGYTGQKEGYERGTEILQRKSLPPENKQPQHIKRQPTVQ